MFTKLGIGGALVLTVGLSGGAWALANKKADNCCFPGSDCCYPGSLCCDGCCFSGCPCCGDAPSAAPTVPGAQKVDCCLDPTCPPGCAPDCPPNCCDGDKARATPKPASGTKCEGGKCTDACKGN
jgi:hypothetical protein